MINVDENILPDSYSSVNNHAASKNAGLKTSGRPTTEEMFKPVSNATLQKIRKIYKNDYEYFSYTMPQWLKNP